MSRPKYLLDENITERLADTLRRLEPSMDIATISELGLKGTPDEEVLRLALREDRIVVSHDVATMKPMASEWIAAGNPAPGCLFIPQGMRLRDMANDLLMIWAASEADEWPMCIEHLPY